MGNTHWDDLSGKKRWKKAHAEKKAELFAIARKYRLTKDTKPTWIVDDSVYFTFESFEYDAKNYADMKYAHTAYVSGYVGIIVAGVITIVSSIIGVLAAPVSGGTSLYAAWSAGTIATSLVVGLTLGSVAIGLTGMFIVRDIQNSSTRAKNQAQFNEYRASASMFKEAALERSNTIANLMIYAKYEIYASNSIYNQGRAGDCFENNTYTPSQAYDPTRGMRGDLAQDTKPFDDALQYRAHTNLGGNRDFMQHMIGTDFPLQQVRTNYAQANTQISQNMDSRLAEINEGFGELIDAGAGLSYRHKLEETSNPAKRYEEILNVEMGYFKNKMSTNTNLELLERYRNGQWASFDFLYFREQTKQRESTMANVVAMIQEWDSTESQAYRDSLSEEELLKVVIEMMIYSLEAGISMFEGNVYRYNVKFFSDALEKGDQDDQVLNSFDTSRCVSARDVLELFNIFVFWLDKDSILKPLSGSYPNYQYDESFPPFTLEYLATIYHYLHVPTFSKDRLTIVKNQEKAHNAKILMYYPKYFTPPSDFLFGYFGLDREGVSDEFITALTKKFWDSRLDFIDLSAYSLKDLGLAWDYAIF